MKYPLQLNISNCCDQDWNQMQPSGMGRDCTHCQKTVIDFTCWSDAALYEFFANNQTKVCGRFLKTQLGRPIAIPHQPHSRLYRMTIALGLTLIFTQTPDAIAQSRAPKAKQTIVHHKGGVKKPVKTPKEYTLKQHMTVYRRPLVDDTRSMITGEVAGPFARTDTPVMHSIVSPPLSQLPSTTPPKSKPDTGDVKLDIDNPTRRVMKR